MICSQPIQQEMLFPQVRMLVTGKDGAQLSFEGEGKLFEAKERKGWRKQVERALHSLNYEYL